MLNNWNSKDNLGEWRNIIPLSTRVPYFFSFSDYYYLQLSSALLCQLFIVINLCSNYQKVNNP